MAPRGLARVGVISLPHPGRRRPRPVLPERKSAGRPRRRTATRPGPLLRARLHTPFLLAIALVLVPAAVTCRLLLHALQQQRPPCEARRGGLHSRRVVTASANASATQGRLGRAPGVGRPVLRRAVPRLCIPRRLTHPVPGRRPGRVRGLLRPARGSARHRLLRQQRPLHASQLRHEVAQRRHGVGRIVTRLLLLCRQHGAPAWAVGHNICVPTKRTAGRHAPCLSRCSTTAWRRGRRRRPPPWRVQQWPGPGVASIGPQRLRRVSGHPGSHRPGLVVARLHVRGAGAAPCKGLSCRAFHGGSK